MTGGKKGWKLIGKVLGVLFSAVLLVLAAVSLILARPQGDNTDPPPPQPSVSASPALEIHREEDLFSFVAGFPAPVMSFMSGSGMTFVSATSADTAVSGGFGRVANLYWQTAEGQPLILQSIYPASALSLLEGGYHFSPTAGPTLFGSLSVRMEKEENIRLHLATDQALYVVLLPQTLENQITTLCRSLQLFTVNQTEE